MICSYLRVSTDKQDEAAQRLGVEQYAAARSIRVDRWVSDTKSGATTWRNRALADVMQEVKPGDQLIVAEISRIGRSTLDVLDFLQYAAGRELVVHIVKQNMLVDASINSKIVTTMLALAGEIEREFIRARTIEGMEAARKSGRRVGRPSGPSETLKLQDKREEVLRLAEARVSNAAIANLTGVHRNTVSRFLQRYKQPSTKGQS